MFGLSVATEIFQGSTTRTWNCVSHFVHLLWTKLNQIRQPIMPKSRKRHHSRSRSRSRSHSRDRSHEREDKHRKNDSHEKDRDGKRRKIESYDSPTHKRSVSSERQQPLIVETLLPTDIVHHEQCEGSKSGKVTVNEKKNDSISTPETVNNEAKLNENAMIVNENSTCENKNEEKVLQVIPSTSNQSLNIEPDSNFRESDTIHIKDSEDTEVVEKEGKEKETNPCDKLINPEDVKGKGDIADSDEKMNVSVEGSILLKQNKLEITPKKVLSPKQVKKKLESEKKRIERQLEKDEKERKRIEEKERIKEEKLQRKREKEMKEEQKKKEREEKEEQKKREREEKEEQKKREREEKEQKKKEREEKEEQKRKEREQEKLKKQQEIEEKNKEKQKEEEKKQKAAAAFVNFFVAKKSDSVQEYKKSGTIQPYAFKAFEVKSDMKLPPARRTPLSEKEKETLINYIENQNYSMSYIKELKSGKVKGKSYKTWPFEETVDYDVTIIEDGGNLGETICEDLPKTQKLRAKFLKFRENRRPAYFGTWRKKSKIVTGRRPFAVDKNTFNYEEDSDDDWEEDEQGESLNGSDDEADKENDEDKDDYEVDNEFFVPHGHLSEDEIDDEEKASLSPESLKQKLKLLKDEFDQDIHSKTHRLKPRSIGCIWLNKEGNNVEEAILRYLQPFAMITNGTVQIGKRGDMFTTTTSKRKKPTKELDPKHVPLFLKVIHGNCNKKTVLVEQFMTYMANNGFSVDIKKTTLVNNLRQLAAWKKCKENGPMKNKFCWLVDDEIKKKYNADLPLPNTLERAIKE